MVELKVIQGGKKDFVTGKYEGVFDTPTLQAIEKRIAEAPGFMPDQEQNIKWDGLLMTAPERPVPYVVEESVKDVGLMIASSWRHEKNAFLMEWAEHAWKSEALKEVASQYPYLLVAELHAYNPLTNGTITNARTMNKYDFEGVYVEVFLNNSGGDAIVFNEKWGDKTVAAFNELERASPVAGNAIAFDARHYSSNAYPTKEFERKYILTMFASKEEIMVKKGTKRHESDN